MKRLPEKQPFFCLKGLNKKNPIRNIEPGSLRISMMCYLINNISLYLANGHSSSSTISSSLSAW